VFFQTKWQPEKSKPFALFVGGISPRKGIQDLVEAFRDPKQSSSELLMIVGGEGVWSVNLQISALRNIRWLGRKKAEETAILMAQAWWLVLPTRADTILNVVKEARLGGLPVITTRSGGQAICLPGEAEQEVGGECAIYANPPSPEKVEEKLREAFERCKNTDTIQTGVRHARGYTWQRSLEVHAQALIPKKD
jgi:glycosyltransferase involved in cell wall biosynthesis